MTDLLTPKATAFVPLTESPSSARSFPARKTVFGFAGPGGAEGSRLLQGVASR